MDSVERKKIVVIYKYALENFSEGDWYTLGQSTGSLNLIQNHSRLLRSMSFGDDDYDYCVSEVINTICEENPEHIEAIIDLFDIDIWYEQKDLKKYKKIFTKSLLITPDFWEQGYLKAFISHLAVNKNRVTSLKSKLEVWGISSFVAHTDIEPSREWMQEIEKALSSMDILIAVVEPGFNESNWTDQEIGFALGRNVDIIPLRAGLDPYGFMGKYQGIQIKSKVPEVVAQEIVSVLLKKPNYRDKLILSMSRSFRTMNSNEKIEKIKLIDSWNIISVEQLKNLLENIALSENEKTQLNTIISKSGAFTIVNAEDTFESEIPF